MVPLSDRFSDALTYAERLHRAQTRKGNDIHYVAHLMAVTATALEWGADEDTAIAALLHDAVEDQGGMETAEAIRARFGGRVADIVLACTDSLAADPAEKAPWEDRKRQHLEKLQHARVEVAQVTGSDKLHNLTSLIRDVRRDGPSTMQRFARPDRLVWYYKSVAEALARHEGVAPVAENRDGVEVLTQTLGADPG